MSATNGPSNPRPAAAPEAFNPLHEAPAAADLDSTASVRERRLAALRAG